MKKLTKLCNYFHKMATLESDMAHRIMYSILPTIDNEHTYYDQETQLSSYYNEHALTII